MSRRVATALHKLPLADRGTGAFAIGAESVPIGTRYPERGLRPRHVPDSAPTA